VPGKIDGALNVEDRIAVSKEGRKQATGISQQNISSQTSYRMITHSLSYGAV
jgi:hypothetical protein